MRPHVLFNYLGWVFPGNTVSRKQQCPFTLWRVEDFTDVTWIEIRFSLIFLRHPERSSKDLKQTEKKEKKRYNKILSEIAIFFYEI